LTEIIGNATPTNALRVAGDRLVGTLPALTAVMLAAN
jgi:hypothetical protein